jgi:hypothetical protein
MSADSHIPDGVTQNQRWFYHPEVQARIAQAEADFREGNCTYTATPEEAEKFLDSLKNSGTPSGSISRLTEPE